MTAGAERKGNGERMRDEKINQIQIATNAIDCVGQQAAMPPVSAYSATPIPKQRYAEYAAASPIEPPRLEGLETG